jgi:nicotinate-nucleotide--dimethylbenzimidazole phosphoribosyltransferase
MTSLAIRPVDDPALAARIQHRLDHLTKPLGSLGRLEDLILRYGLARGTADLRLARQAMFVFCADHGIAAEGVSAYPAEVTTQMVRNFAAGGAAINVLCRQLRIEPRIVDVGVNGEFEPELRIVRRKIAPGTRNFLREPAMTLAQASAALEIGITLATDAAGEGFDLLGAGEMGIGNTTSAAAITAALTGCDPEAAAGPGTGITEIQRQHKADVIRRALALHRPNPRDPLAVLAAVGGFEIAALAGLLLGAASRRLPVAVDGFIASAGALVAARLAPEVLGYLFFSHRSAEPGHALLLEAIGARPLLSLDLRLGEGTGAALAMSLVDSAVRLYNEMATFDAAGVSERSP